TQQSAKELIMYLFPTTLAKRFKDALRHSPAQSRPRRSRKVQRRACLRLESLQDRMLLSAGLTPFQVRHAYGFHKIKFAHGTIPGDGRGQTIAIVDAYSDPNIGHDLQVFDQTFHLAAPPKFTVATFGNDSTSQLALGWAGETALDVEWAHAIAPKA